VVQTLSETRLFEVGRNCCAVAPADRLALLVDGAAYFDAFMRAAARAQRSILVLAWDFDSRTRLSFEPGVERPRLGDLLNSLARRTRRLQVHILDWDYPMIYGQDRELPPLYGLGWKPHRRVHLRYDGTHPLTGSQHQKIVVIDDKIAFVGGLDLATRRWDTPEHRPDDPRRLANGKPYPPFHDAMVAVDGEAARVLACIARRRWHHATGETLAPVRVSADPWPESLEPDIRDLEIGIACTAPATNGKGGAREVEQLYLDMIDGARRYIYIENQYFTARTIGERLAARLAEPDGPEVVVVTRLLSHGWLEEVTMHVLRTRLIRELRAADRHNRFQVYYPHMEGLAPGTCIDIHSKVMIVDDQWLRVGSSNLSNRSMGVDTECDVVVEARGDPAKTRAVVAFRDRLLGEHLGVPAEEVARQVRRAGTIQRAIAAMQSEGRTLKPLDSLTEWPAAVVDAIAIADPEKPVSLEALVEQFAPEADREGGRPAWRKIIAAALIAAALALAWRFTPLANLADGERIAAWAREFGGRWWAGPLVVMAYTPACVVLFPRAVITFVAVITFGPWLGFLCAMAGNLSSALATYLTGRYFKRDAVRRIAGEKLNRLSHVLRKRGWLAVTAVRLVPLAPFAVENVVAGAVHVDLRHYMLGTFLGMLPGTLAATVFGDQLSAALTGGSSIDYTLVGCILLVLAGGAFAVRRWLAKLESEDAPSKVADTTHLPGKKESDPVRGAA
jgi:phosphatidylserine/phosphatidylglycerophosphate/cardiolipin synthase-like enzyme/membrane protein DedA with SNARE-associated domain